MSAKTEDLGAILRTIREVEESLDHRVKRAVGVNLMIWGLVSGTIFLFYQLVEWNAEPYRAALGPALSWAWLGPIAVGYVASALVGTRMGRVARDGRAWAQYRVGLIPAALATFAATALVLAGRGELIAGVLVTGMGAFFLATCDRSAAFGRAATALGIAQVVAGIGLLLLAPAWSSLAAAVAMGGGLLGIGIWAFVTAR